MNPKLSQSKKLQAVPPTQAEVTPNSVSSSPKPRHFLCSFQTNPRSKSNTIKPKLQTHTRGEPPHNSPNTPTISSKKNIVSKTLVCRISLFCKLLSVLFKFSSFLLCINVTIAAVLPQLIR